MIDGIEIKSILDLTDTDDERQRVLAMLMARLEPIPYIGCHVWLGWNDGKRGEWGHGKFQYKGVALYVHRAVYELTKGRIAPGLILDHLCCVEACSIETHLEPVPMGENTLRGPGRKYQFRRPEEYDPMIPPFPHPVTPKEIDAAFELKEPDPYRYQP